MYANKRKELILVFTELLGKTHANWHTLLRIVKPSEKYLRSFAFIGGITIFKPPLPYCVCVQHNIQIHVDSA